MRALQRLGARPAEVAAPPSTSISVKRPPGHPSEHSVYRRCRKCIRPKRSQEIEGAARNDEEGAGGSFARRATITHLA